MQLWPKNKDKYDEAEKTTKAREVASASLDDAFKELKEVLERKTPRRNGRA